MYLHSLIHSHDVRKDTFSLLQPQFENFKTDGTNRISPLVVCSVWMFATHELLRCGLVTDSVEMDAVGELRPLQHYFITY